MQPTRFTRLLIPLAAAVSMTFSAMPELAAAPASVVFSAQEGVSALAMPDGSALPAGSLLRLGWFDLSAADVTNGLDNLTLLNASFHELGRGPAGYWEGFTTVNATGAVTGRSDGWDGGMPAFFTHQINLDPQALGISAQQFYIWVMNAPDLSGATVHGIFSDNGWTMPSFGSATFELGSASPSDLGDVYVGIRGPGGYAGNPAFPLNHLVPVPEPGAGMGLLLSILVFATRRRQP